MSYVGFGGDPSLLDGVEEGVVVAFGLVGVGGREPGDGMAEDVGAAEVGGDGDPVPGAGAVRSARIRPPGDGDPRAQGLQLPRRKAGARRIAWADASYPAVHDFLTNPANAGAFVFGRTTTKTEIAGGKKATRHRQLPQEEWVVLIPGHHPGYLSWDAYQDNQARLRAGYRAPRGDVVREMQRIGMLVDLPHVSQDNSRRAGCRRGPCDLLA
jgi:hypothetical protein